MSEELTVQFKVHFGRGQKGRKHLREGEAPGPSRGSTGNVPRIAKLMALAIHLGELVRSGKVKDYADLARLGHVTRARMTQIINLLNLAPDIQEEILYRSSHDAGTTVHERNLRPIAAQLLWSMQRKMWQQLGSSNNS